MFVICLVLTAVIALASAPASADDASQSGHTDDLSNLSLEDLLETPVYAASKFVQDMTHAPASVSIVSADEIHRHGYRTLADILRSVRGFYITYDRDYRYVGVRGFARPGDFNSRVLLLVNGHRLNDTIFEQALIGTESPIDVALIDRVEVVRGPSSSLYGTSAFLAVVNIVTRSGRSVQGGEVEGGLGSQRLRSGRATVGRRGAQTDLLLSAGGFRSDGERTLYFPSYDVAGLSNGIASNVDADRAGSLFGSLTAGALRLQGGYSSRTKTIPTAAYSTLFDDDRTRTTDRRGFLAAEYTGRPQPRITLQMRASFDSYGYDGRFAYADGLLEDGARGDWLTAEATLSQQFAQHGLTAGVEYRDNLRQNQYASDHTGPLLDDRRNTETAALFVEDELRLGSHVIVNGGARWDHYFETFGSTVSPRLGVILLPRPGTAVKALYGRAFRAPNPFELYYDQNALSATLKPEQISTYELVWEERLAPALQVTASAFEYRARDLIAQRKGDSSIDDLYYQNIDTANASGVELEVQAEWPGRLRARASQVRQQVNDAATGARLSNSPSYLSALVLDVPIGRRGLLVAANTTLVGPRHTVGGGTVGRAFVSDVTLVRPAPAHGIGLSLTIGNLFDASYADPGSVEHLEQSIPQDGRTASMRATWRF